MAFDGITVAHLAHELQTTLEGGRIHKIAQPEGDELLLTFKLPRGSKRLCISASPSLPLLYLTDENKPSPMTAPNFCMLLRKHLNNGKIMEIRQPGMERILEFHIEHMDELGDLGRKILIVELMGRHSNIIFCNADYVIIDSIKRVSSQVSSVRQVLPGRTYFVPDTMGKMDPLNVSKEDFIHGVSGCDLDVPKGLNTLFTGVSYGVGRELWYLTSKESGLLPLGNGVSLDNQVGDDLKMDEPPLCKNLSTEQLNRLYTIFVDFFAHVKKADFTPVIYYKNGEPVDYASLPLSHLMLSQTATVVGEDNVVGESITAGDASSAGSGAADGSGGNGGCSDAGNNNITADSYTSISECILKFYETKSIITRIRQKSADLRAIVTTALERNKKKLKLQEKQLADTNGRDKYKVYGELIHTYGYSLEAGADKLIATNYYDNQEVSIPLDTTLSAMDNAQKYFNRYNKQKRTFEALTELIVETQADVDYLESVSTSLEMARSEDDLMGIKDELIEAGYVKRRHVKKKVKYNNEPLHFISSDGYDIYVGKNNLQNEFITFELAEGRDWWFHAKGVAGSHVLVKPKGEAEMPDRVYEEAGRLAGYYSKLRGGDKVEIDYIEKKHVKKPKGGKPGLVIYHTNYSLIIDTDISMLRTVN